MITSAISAEHLSKSYGRKRVLEDVTFRIRRGEVAAIVGENGSGKTTVLKILAGLFKPDSGILQIRGRMGYCPQECQLFESLTVHENLLYFAAAYRWDDWRKSERNLLARLRFESFRDMQVSKLSGGTRQKLNLAIALLHDPDVLILDEPYSAFDWETYLRFWDLAAELKRTGKTVLLVSHFVYDRSQMDSLYELKGGILQ
jgi:ABC-type multidrug transport system ATPase subunit